MRLRYRRSAIEDLGEIRDYIARDNPIAAKRFVERLLARCRLLSATPHRSRTFGHPTGPRSLPIQNYIVFYRLVDDTVEIVSVVHGSRDVDPFMGEEP